MGLYTLCLAGGGLVIIGVWEALTSSYAHLNPSSSPPSPPNPSPITNPKTRSNPFFPSVSFIAIALLSFFFIFNSMISLSDAFHTSDRVGFALQLDVISIISLFFLYSIVGLLINFTNSIPLPSSILDLIAVFAFGQEFIIFYLQRKDPIGLENRYFDLLLVPITVCIFSTILKLGCSKSFFPSLARGVGLILQGTWLVQMGFSFFTNWMAHGCALHEKSRGNFTVKCKGHPEYHRSKAIATLQFNCHLAFLVVLIVGVYSFIARKYGFRSDYLNYKPLNAELRQLDRQTQFTLDSDDEIILEETVAKQNDVGIVPHLGVNGFGAH